MPTYSVTIQGDPTAAAAPVSGTVTSNIGTTGGLALDTTVAKLTLAQGATTSGESGPLIQGAVTTGNPSYTNLTTNPLSLDLAGNLRTTVTSGTLTANAGTGTFTVGQATGTNLHMVVDSGSITIANASLPVTQSGTWNLNNISGTISLPTGASTSANQTTANASLATIATAVSLAQGSTTSGQTGALTLGAVTTGNPTYTTGQTSALSLDLAGNLRTTVTSGTITANAGTGTFAISAVSLPLPTGAATSALQTTGNTSLSTIATAVSLAQGSATSGQTGNLTLAAVTTAAPTYTTGQTNPLSLDTSGNLRVTLASGTATVVGNKTNNNAAPGATNLGVLNAIANAAAPTWTEGNQVLQSVDLAGNLRTLAIGNVASAAADSGNPVKIGAVYTNPLPVVTSGQRVNLQCDPSGRLYIAPTPNLSVSTFGSNAIFTFAAAATDIYTIYGSATKTIKITRIDIDGTATATSINTVVLIKRTTADTGGTPTLVTPTRYDTNTAGGTATSNFYTANPVLGTPQGTTGIVAAYKVTFLAAATAGDTLLTLDFQRNGAGPIVLNAATEGLCINMNGATVAGNSISINIEWTEE